MNGSNVIDLEIDGVSSIAFIQHEKVFAESNWDKDPLLLARTFMDGQPRGSPFKPLRDKLFGDSSELNATFVTINTSMPGEYTLSADAGGVGTVVRASSATGHGKVRVVAFGSETIEWPRTIGDVLVLLSHVYIPEMPGVVATGVHGILPWDLFTDAMASTSQVPLNAVIPNSHTPLKARSAAFLGSLVVDAQPFELVPISSDTDKASIDAVLSFALRWHMASSSTTNPLVRRRNREKLLLNRSFRFFGKDSPLVALFRSSNGLAAAYDAVRSLATKRTQTFVVVQLCMAIDFIMKDLCGDKLRDSELAFRSFCTRLLAPLANSIANTPVPTVIAPGKVEPVAPKEPLEASVDSIGSLVDSGTLSEAKAVWLARLWMPEVGQEDPSSLTQKERNRVCFSYNFFGGTPVTTEMLTDKIVKMREHVVMQAGRAYTCNMNVLRRSTTAFFRHFLTESAGGGRLGGQTEEATTLLIAREQQFAKAMPKSGTVYPDERVRSFDDCTHKSKAHTQIHLKLDREQFREFAMRRRETVDLPDDYDEARQLQLCESQARSGSDGSQFGQMDAQGHSLATLTVGMRNPPSEFTSEQREEAIQAVMWENNSPERAMVLGDLKNILIQNAKVVSERLSYENDVFEAKRDGREPPIKPPMRRSPLEDFEDRIEVLARSGALPLSMQQYAQKVLFDRNYLRNEDRKIYYRLLASLGFLTHEEILLHILRETPTLKLEEQYGDMNKGFQAMAEKMHSKAIQGAQRSALERSVDLSEDDARDSTTCAASNYTLQKNKNYPLADWKNLGRLTTALKRSGVDGVRAFAIAQQAVACRLKSNPTSAQLATHSQKINDLGRLHLHAILTPEMTSPEPPVMHGLRLKHPRDFVFAVAHHRLLAREQVHERALATSAPAPLEEDEE